MQRWPAEMKADITVWCTAASMLLDVPHDQRVVAAHFQRQHLARLAAELLVQRDAGLAAAGEQDAVDVRVAAPARRRCRGRR